MGEGEKADCAGDEGGVCLSDDREVWLEMEGRCPCGVRRYEQAWACSLSINQLARSERPGGETHLNRFVAFYL